MRASSGSWKYLYFLIISMNKRKVYLSKVKMEEREKTSQNKPITVQTSSDVEQVTDLSMSEINNLYKKALNNDQLGEEIPEGQVIQRDLSKEGIVTEIVKHGDLESRHKRLVNYHDDDPEVRELEKTTDYILQEVNEEMYPGHLYFVGSCADECRVGRTSEMDTLYVMIGNHNIMQEEGKTSFCVYSKSGQKISPLQLREKFAEAVARAVERCPYIGGGQVLSHGGYNAPQFSGVRYSGPAVTILLRTRAKNLPAPAKPGIESEREVKEQFSDISIDITPAFKLPVGHDVVQKVRDKMHPLQKVLPRKFISKTDVHLVPDVKNDTWMLTTALLEAKLFSSLPDNSSLKMAFALGKIVNYTSSHTDHKPRTSLQQRLVRTLENMKKSPPDDARYLEWNRGMRYAHNFLGEKDAIDFHECAKPDVSANSAAFKHILLKKVLDEPSFFKGVEDLEKDFKELVLGMLQFISTLHNSAVPHAFLDGCYLSAFSLSKTALLSERRLQLKQHVRAQYRLHDLFDETNRCGDLISTRSTLLIDAAEWGQQLMVRLLLQAGADINAENEGGFTALYKACLQEHSNVAEVLVSRGADIEKGAYPPLMAVSYHGFIEVVRWLLEIGADVNAKDKKGYTALSLACSSGHLNVAKTLVSQGAQIEEGGKLPLGRAAFGGHMKVVKWLLESGADINAEDKDGYTALSLASERGHLDVAKTLVSQGAEIEKGGKLPLGRAALGGHMEVVKWLLELGADINAEDKNRFTAISAACERGHLEVGKVLVSRGAEIEKGGYPALERAACRGHKEVVQWLLELGADINAENKNGYTALSSACDQGHMEVGKVLVSEGAEIEKGGYPALERAAFAGHMGIVQWLIESDADINTEDKNGFTALSASCEQGHLEVGKVLVLHGAEIEKEGYSALERAAIGGHMKIVHWLLELGADINAEDKNGFTALSASCEQGHLEVGKVLVSKGAEIEKGGYPALERAARGGHMEVVQWLLELGADVNTEDKDGFTALSVSCEQGHLGVGKVLVSHGAEIEKGGYPALERAVYGGHVKVVKWLLELGADVNAMTRDSGGTALCGACQNGHTEVAHELIKHGADLELGVPLGMAAWSGHMELMEWLLQKRVKLDFGDKFGATPLYYASIAGNIEVAKMLVHHGALVDVGKLKPLGGAACYTQIDIVKWLLDTAGADVGVSDKDGDTALHCVCRTGQFSVVDRRSSKDGWPVSIGGNKKLQEKDKPNHLGIVEILLRKGINVNAINNAGLTALYYACAHGYHEVAEELVKHGAKVDLGVNKPLIGAALGGHVKTTTWLLELGADVNAVDSDGHSALWHITNKKEKLDTDSTRSDEHRKLDEIYNLLKKL